MIKLPLCNIKGENIGELEIADDMLELKRGGQATRDEIVAHMARSRSGTASTLGKSEVSASRKKPWKQKGLGRARSGYRTSPVWRGGGIAFGPHPRDYSFELPRKAAKLAFRRAMSEKLAGGRVAVVDEFTLDEPRTRAMASTLKGLKASFPLLLIVETISTPMKLAGRNIRGLELASANNVHAYSLLKNKNLLVTRAALDVLTARMKKDRKAGG